VSQSYLRAGVCVFDKLRSVSEMETLIWMDVYWRTCVSIPCVAWILFNTKASVNTACKHEGDVNGGQARDCHETNRERRSYWKHALHFARKGGE
jgi:hypothetical protein